MNDTIRVRHLIRATLAIESDLTASECARDCDEGLVPPDAAARAAWDASEALRAVGLTFLTCADQQMFAARRFDAAQRREIATGTEHRGPERPAA